VTRGEQTTLVPGKIVRSGYVPHRDAYPTFGSAYQMSQQAYGNEQPIIQVAGKLQFTLPGIPPFPSLSDDSILQPTLDWQVVMDKAGPVAAELAYVTGGMTWKAAYNVVSPEVGSTLDLTGWVTMDNESGRVFSNARIKLMAGDVSKVQDNPNNLYQFSGSLTYGGRRNDTPAVTEQTPLASEWRGVERSESDDAHRAAAGRLSCGGIVDRCVFAACLPALLGGFLDPPCRCAADHKLGANFDSRR